MSQYTTGEMAKLCGVSVRTVQYYDTRGIVCPSALSEGGRRLYSEENLQEMQIVCFLRELGLKLETIAEMKRDESSAETIRLLLEQQMEETRQEIAEKQAQLNRLHQLLSSSKSFGHMSVQTIGDIAFTMKQRNKLRKLHLQLLLRGILVDVLVDGTLLLWIFTGIWQPFPFGLAAGAAITVQLFRMYHRKVLYICPHCHGKFKPGMKEFFFSRHTPRTRRLACPLCGETSFCVETIAGE